MAESDAGAENIRLVACIHNSYGGSSSDGSEICSRKKNLQELYKDSVFVEVDDVVMLSGKAHH